MTTGGGVPRLHNDGKSCGIGYRINCDEFVWQQGGVGVRGICKHCDEPFVITKLGQKFCSRICSNKGRNSRRTTALNRLCDCGSGLPAKRTTVPDSAGFRIGCDACKVLIQPRTVPVRAIGNDYDRAQAVARRRIEEMREMRMLEGAHD